MKIYLDTSTINRIFDDQTKARIYLEAAASLLIFTLIEKNYFDLVSSEVLIYENDKNPYEERKLFVSSIIKNAKQFQKLDEKILERAKEIEKLGIRGLDALHLACAERAGVNYFLTCDNKLIKRYREIILVKNPVEFVFNIIEEESKNDK